MKITEESEIQFLKNDCRTNDVISQNILQEALKPFLHIFLKFSLLNFSLDHRMYSTNFMPNGYFYFRSFYILFVTRGYLLIVFIELEGIIIQARPWQILILNIFILSRVISRFFFTTLFIRRRRSSLPYIMSIDNIANSLFYCCGILSSHGIVLIFLYRIKVGTHL